MKKQRPIQFLRSSTFIVRYPTVSLYKELAQNKSQIFTIGIEEERRISYKNAEIWIKLNPNFVYVGSNPKVRSEVVNGEEYLVIKEGDVKDVRQDSASYYVTWKHELEIKALPSAATGSYKVIEGIWRNLTDTLDYAEELAIEWPYQKPVKSDYYESRMRYDFLGMQGTKFIEGDTINTTVVLNASSGVYTMPGVGMKYSNTNTTTFKPHEYNNLKHMTMIAGRDSNVKDYTTTLNIPNANNSNLPLYLKDEPTVRIAGEDTSADVQLTYKVGDSYVPAAQVSKWDEVESIKVFIPDLPGSTTAIVEMNIQADKAAVDKLKKGTITETITGHYEYHSPGVEQGITGDIPVANYTAELYKVEGFVFNDANPNNIYNERWDDPDSLAKDVVVNLYLQELPGIPFKVATTTTLSNGRYAFEDLPIGNYYVEVELPGAPENGVYYKFAERMLANEKGSHVDESGSSTLFELGEANNDYAVNAGLQKIGYLKAKLVDQYNDVVAEDTITDLPMEYKGNYTLSENSGLQLPEGYTLYGSEQASKEYVLKWNKPVAEVEFRVSAPPQSYYITYHSNYPGTKQNEEVKHGPFPRNQLTALLNSKSEFTDTGHTVNGWNTKVDGSGQSYPDNAQIRIGNADLMLYAQWDIDSYTVSYNTQGGSAVASASVTYGSTTSKPADPTRTGYTFAGWTKDAAGEHIWDFDQDTVLADVELFAQWDINSYTVSYNAQGGSAVASASVTYGSTATKPADPTLTGYTFTGWTKDPAGVHIWDFDYDTILGDTELFAQWDINAYTVSYNTQGGSAVASASVTYGSTASKPADPTRTGYTFAGWTKDAAGEHVWDFDQDTVLEDVELFAQWDINSYTVNYNTQGGSAVSSASVTYGSTTSKPADPTRTGYTFAGWTKDAAGEHVWDFGQDTVLEDVELFAQWNINSYTVSYNTQGGSAVASASVTYGSTASKPADPTRADHTFRGWTKDAAGNHAWHFDQDTVLEDVELFAQWTAIIVPPTPTPVVPTPTPVTPTPTPTPVTPTPTPTTPVATPIPTEDITGGTTAEPEEETPVIPARPVTREEYKLQNAATLKEMEEAGVPTFKIDNLEIPLSGIGYEAVWSLLNLVLAVIGACISVIVGVRHFTKKKNEQERANNNLWKILTVLMGIALVILFVLVQNMNNLMVLIDKWTPLMVVIFGVELVCIILSRFKKKTKDSHNLTDTPTAR